MYLRTLTSALSFKVIEKTSSGIGTHIGVIILEAIVVKVASKILEQISCL
jgi:hypothetical protein